MMCIRPATKLLVVTWISVHRFQFYSLISAPKVKKNHVIFWLVVGEGSKHADTPLPSDCACLPFPWHLLNTVTVNVTTRTRGNNAWSDSLQIRRPPHSKRRAPLMSTFFKTELERESEARRQSNWQNLAGKSSPVWKIHCNVIGSTC